MIIIDCESVRLAAMAIADGENASVRAEEIETHLAGCDRCRNEIEQLRNTDELFRLQKRLRSEVDVWPIVSERIESSSASAQPGRWWLLLLFGIPLFGYKLFVFSVQAAPSLWSKLLLVVLIVAIFTYLRTNPFKINCELSLKGERLHES